jgi:hypothetical protein
MKHQLTILVILLLIGIRGMAHEHSISGQVTDAADKSSLIGAVVQVKDHGSLAATTDISGNYKLNLPTGTYTIVYHYVGYQTLTKQVSLVGDITLDAVLAPENGNLNEVVITAIKKDNNVRSTDIGMFRLDPKTIESVPVLFGEKDIIKTFQLTPGVKAAGEGNAGFYVRGGAADQNLVLLDGAPVYNASHMLGFFSVFNSDALRDAALYKSGTPAEYGGRASSVLDVTMRDGNKERLSASGGLGTIASRLTVEGPLGSEKGSFIVSGRRTYADLFLKLSSNERIKNSKLYFYDLNAKANYQLSDRDRLDISGYFGRDVFKLKTTFGTDWGNTAASVRWNHVVNSRVFTNTSLLYSNYDYRIRFHADKQDLVVTSGIRDWSLKEDVNYTLNNKNSIKAGVNIIYHNLRPTILDASAESDVNADALEGRKAVEGAVYVQDEMELNERIGLQFGLRYSSFTSLGSATVYTYDAAGNKTSEKKYGKGQRTSSYGGFEPRLGVRYMLNEKSSIKASYNRMFQYLHLLSNSTTSSPIDQWTPTSNNVKPQIMDQVSLGYFRNFRDNMFELSVETYYKNMQNQIDYRPGADLLFNQEVEGELVYGKGIAYGAEFLLRKQTGRLTGWVSYTLSRSLRRFDQVNNGTLYPAKQDRVHDLAIVAMYALTDKIKLSANWVYYTGNAATFPSGKYESDGMTVPYYTDRNSYRMPSYHRLDLGATVYTRKTDRYESSWNFSLYNAYGRENAYTIDFRQNETDPTKTEAVQTSLFRWVPSITYNFKF